MEVAEAVALIQEKINISASRAGRNPDEIKLVAVTKMVGFEKIAEAARSGITIFGENRVQEADEKISNFKFQISNYKVQWHLIGNLQKNKAKTAVQLFDLIHSVDTEELAVELDRRCRQMDKRQRVLVQVKLSDEPAKHGIPNKNLMRLLEKVASMKNLILEGLMTIPPFSEDPEKTRPFFKDLRELANKAAVMGFPVRELSMGMSNDFEVAIEEGATMVRVGTAIFGERPVKV